MSPTPPPDPITVGQAVTTYLADVGRAVGNRALARTTAANYTRDLTEFTDLAGADTPLPDLDGPTLDTILSTYRATPDRRYAHPKAGPDGTPKTRGERAQARFRQSLTRLFTAATAHGWITTDPMHDTTIRPRLKGPSRATTLSAATATTLLDLPALLDQARHARGTDRPDMRLARRDEFLLRLMVEVGPRVSEISAANQDDLSTRDDTTTWLRLLGRREHPRQVPLSAETAAAYQRYLDHERPPPRPRIRKFENEHGVLTAQTTATADDAARALVLTWRGRRMTPRDIQLMVARMQARLPVTVRGHLTPHGLRTTAAALLLDSGAADLPTVEAMLGYTTPGTLPDRLEPAMTAAIARHPVTGSRTHPPT